MNAGAAPADAFGARAAQILADKFAPWVQELGLAIESDGPIVLRLPLSAHLARVGGMVCGQAMMAAADTAMVLVVAEALGDFVEMATVNMATSFLAAARDEDLLVAVTLTKLGRTMAFGDARLSGAVSGTLCAQASLIYSIRRP